MNHEKKKSLAEVMESLQELSAVFNAAMKEIEVKQEAYWDSLTKEQQLMAFCAVVRRIHRGEIVEDRSFRGMMYDVFGFGLESYGQAQDAGYLDIHNLEYETIEQCISVIQNAVEQNVPTSEYANLIRNHFK
jgi:hypothetical protein